jgi:hypothetical protein
MAEIEVYIELWAYMSREGPPVGWYTEQPWYTPSNGYRESNVPISDDDVEKAEAVGEILNRMRETDEDGHRLVKIYYRAIPNDEPSTISYRIHMIEEELSIDRREIYRRLKSIKTYLEGAMSERYS